MSIKVENLGHIYSQGLPHESIALKNISFEINDGEFIGVIGHTGSGKSTMLQHLNGLLKPSSGRIEIGGVDITDPEVSMIDIRKRIGLVFQYPEYQLFEETVAKDVAFGPHNLGLEEDEIDSRVREALELVGLPYDEFAEKSPFDLSGGQKRRVAIAGVIAMMPEVLILDEPTAGLDPQSHRDILNMIEHIHEESGNICIFVSHNMNDIARVSDRIIVMNQGSLEMMGTPKEVFSETQRLRSMGLDLPDVTQLMVDLTNSGFAIESGLFMAEDAEKLIVEILEGERVASCNVSERSDEIRQRIAEKLSITESLEEIREADQADDQLDGQEDQDAGEDKEGACADDQAPCPEDQKGSSTEGQDGSSVDDQEGGSHD